MTDPDRAELLRVIHDTSEPRLTSVSERLSDALMSLPAEHRVAVVRAYYLGQTVADVAAIERIPEGAVRARLHHGLRALRIALQDRGVLR
jgi:DNA-directed RNA polymerase specialized sigma24 family protein